MFKIPMNPGWYIAYCSVIDLTVGTANLFFNWFNMELVSVGFILALMVPLIVKPIGNAIGLNSGIFWK